MAKCLKFIATNLEAWMKDADLSQTEVARVSELSPGFIHQLLKQQNGSPGFDKLERIAAVFSKTLDELVRDPADRGGHKVRDCLRITKALNAALAEGDLEHPLVKELVEGE